MGTVLVADSTAAGVPTAQASKVVATVAAASRVDSRVLAARHRAAASVDRMAVVVAGTLTMVDLARAAGRSAVVAAMAVVVEAIVVVATGYRVAVVA